MWIQSAGSRPISPISKLNPYAHSSAHPLRAHHAPFSVFPSLHVKGEGGACVVGISSFRARAGPHENVSALSSRAFLAGRSLGFSSPRQFTSFATFAGWRFRHPRAGCRVAEP